MMVCSDQDLNGDRDACRIDAVGNFAFLGRKDLTQIFKVFAFLTKYQTGAFSTFFQKPLKVSGPNPERTVQAVAVPYSARCSSSSMTFWGLLRLYVMGFSYLRSARRVLRAGSWTIGKLEKHCSNPADAPITKTFIRLGVA